MGVLGIDIGNAFCVVATAVQGGVEVVLNEESSRQTPTCVALGDRQRYLGAAAASPPPGTTIVSQIKRLLGRPFRDPVLQRDLRTLFRDIPVSQDAQGYPLLHLKYRGEDVELSPTHLLGMLLGSLKRSAERQLCASVADCCIAVPAHFNDMQRRAVLQAADIAGLHPLRLLHECTAAVLDYGIYFLADPPKPSRVIAFVDVGHSATPVAVTEFRSGSASILARATDPNLGGRDFDAALFDYFATKLLAEDPNLNVFRNARASARLRMECEKVKKVLSEEVEAEMHVKCFMDDKDVSGIITREEFERICETLLERLRRPIRRALADAGKELKDVEAVELIGSGTLVPAVVKVVAEVFQQEPRRTLNASECVARGCAIQAAKHSPAFQLRGFEVIENVPFAIDVLWKDIKLGSTSESVGCPQRQQIISVRDRIPMNQRLVATTVKNMFSFDLMYSDAIENRFTPAISTYKVDVLKLTQSDNAQLIIDVRLSVDGTISVDSMTGECLEKDPLGEGKTGVQISFTEYFHGAMSTTVLEQVKGMENQMAAWDKQVEETKDRKKSLESYVYEMKKELQGKYDEFVRETDRKDFMERLQQVEKWLYEEGEDEELDAYTSKLVELKMFGEPIERRFRESSERGPAMELLERRIQHFWRSAQDNRPRFAHIENQEKRMVKLACENANEWLQMKRLMQERLFKFEDPVVTAGELRSRTEDLDRSCTAILSRHPSEEDEKRRQSSDHKKLQREEMHGSVVGIDIGNAFCVVVAAGKGGVDVILNEESKRETPTCVALGERQRFLGAAAASATPGTTTVSQIKRLIGRPLDDEALERDLRTLFPNLEVSADRHGYPLLHFQYRGQKAKLSPTQLLGMLLGSLKRSAERHLSAPVSDCCIAVPAHFNDVQRRAVLHAAEIAGLRPLRLLHECSAAVLEYGIYRRDFPLDPGARPHIAAIVDVGHSAVQVAIAEFLPGGARILARAADPNLGGRNFDGVLFDHFAAKLIADDPDLDVSKSARASARLRTSCEKVKKVLSVNPEATLHIECFMEDKDASGIITREEFERKCDPLLQRLKLPLHKALEEAGLRPEEVEAVELIGSGSHAPSVVKVVGEVFKQEPRRTLNVSECVAKGCALQAAMLSPAFRVKEFKEEEVRVPFSEHVDGVLSDEDWKQARKYEIQMTAWDRELEKTKDQKNALESYVYEMRNKLRGKYKEFVSDSEKQWLPNKLQEVEDWLYDEGEDVDGPTYISSLNELKMLFQPIEERFRVVLERESALDRLVKLKSYLEAIADGSVPEYTNLDDQGKRKELDRSLLQIWAECDKVDNWMSTVINRQNVHAKYPVFTAADIQTKIEDLERCLKAIQRFQPAPSKFSGILKHVPLLNKLSGADGNDRTAQPRRSNRRQSQHGFEEGDARPQFDDYGNSQDELQQDGIPKAHYDYRQQQKQDGVNAKMRASFDPQRSQHEVPSPARHAGEETKRYPRPSNNNDERTHPGTENNNENYSDAARPPQGQRDEEAQGVGRDLSQMSLRNTTEQSAPGMQVFQGGSQKQDQLQMYSQIHLQLPDKRNKKAWR